MGTYLIAGGNSGIGKSVASQLKEQGHQVVTTYLTSAPEGFSNGNSIMWNAKNPFPETSLSTEKLDGIVYAIGRIELKPFHRIPENDFLEDFSIQTLGAIRLLKVAFPLLKKSENASVVLYSSIAASKGYPFHSMVSASKGAVEGLTVALAAEWSPTSPR
jgi:NAD(P)-dependent dehydrogenase (short-subunit alcohol dehydrogenase family)